MRSILLAAACVFTLTLAAACGGGDDDGDEEDMPTPPAVTETVEATGATGPSAGEPTPAPTTEASPVPSPEPATVAPEFRDFAPQIAEAVTAKNLDFFVQHAWTEPVTCSAQDVLIQGFFRACAAAGDQFLGLGLSVWGLEGGGLVPAERILELIASMWDRALPEGEDAFGGPEAKLYALGANARQGYDAQLAVITSQIERPAGMAGTGPLRVALVTHWRFEEDDWRLFEVMQAVQFAEGLLEPSADGSLYIQGWEKYPQ